MGSRAKLTGLAIIAVASTLLFACAGGTSSTATGSSTKPQHGGTLSVLLKANYSGAWPTGLDPATNTTGGANLSQMYAIFGGLFTLSGGGKGTGNAEVVPGLATGYEFSDGGKTVEISLRKDVTFQDGTAFNAKAVAWNFRRDVNSPCSCAPTWPLRENSAISTPDSHTVVLHFTRPYGAVIHSLVVSNANWIASPTAFKKMGEQKFKLEPVGAGPFEVVSNRVSSELALKANPNYWKEGRPYLDTLTFKSIGSDQAGYQALLADGAHVLEGVATTPIIEEAKKQEQLHITQHPPTSPYLVQLNTRGETFDSERARAAIYYATNVDAIRQGLFHDWYPASQMFTGPGGLFHRAEIPGYRTYNPEKARQIVNDLGGMEITLGTLKNPLAEKVNTVLQSQWERAGIQVKLESYALSTLVREFESSEWDAILQTAGAWDPAAGAGVGFRFSSTSPFTGVWDPKLESLLQRAAATLENEKRDRLYYKAGKYISDQAYAPFLFAFAPATVSVDGVQGPGVTTKIPPMLVNPTILWEEVWISEQAR